MAISTKRIKSDTPNKIEWVPLDRLVVIPNVQRPLDKARAQSMAKDIDLDLLGIIEISALDNGDYHVADGHHRVTMLRFAGFTNELVQCKVHYGLEQSQNAKLFLGLNDSKHARMFDRFRLRVAAGDPVALGIIGSIEGHGWTFGSGAHTGVFSAVGAAEKVYTGYGTAAKDRGPDTFDTTLGILTTAWGHDASATTGSLIEGVGLMVAKYGDQVDKAALVKQLARTSGGAAGYLGRARGLREFRGGSVARAVAELTVDVYNNRRTAGRLDDWRS